MRLTPAEDKASKLIISDVKCALEEAFGPEEIHMLGFRETGFATPSSDFDFSITPKGGTAAKKNSPTSLKINASDVLRRVQKRIWASPQLKYLRYIPASVPLVQATHCGTGAIINFQTMAPFQASQELIKSWHIEFPSLRSLVITIRTFLGFHNLTTVFEGGVGSYTLVVMVATALKYAEWARDTDDLGGQLLHCLDFWGSADFYKYTYSTTPPFLYEKGGSRSLGIEMSSSSEAPDSQFKRMDEICQLNPGNPYILCLQDPTNHLNDLGRKSYAIRDVQNVFKTAHKWLFDVTRLDQRSISRADGSIRNLVVGKGRPILHGMIQGDFRAFEKARSRLERYADPARQTNSELPTELVSFERQMRAIEFRRRHNLKALITEPHAFTGDWHIALGVRYVRQGASLGTDDAEELSPPKYPQRQTTMLQRTKSRQTETFRSSHGDSNGAEGEQSSVPVQIEGR